MTSFVFGITMFACITPILWIVFLFIYPRDISGHKYIFGVTNREEFKNEQTTADISDIVKSTRTLAFRIMIACTIIAFILLFFHSMVVKTAMWLSFIYLSIMGIMLPYVSAHNKMMTLKRELNITSNQGVSYVDLKNAGSIHALRLHQLIIPNIVGFALFSFSILADLGLINLGNDIAVASSYLTSLISGTMLFTGIIITLIAIRTDKMKNETISTDSDINANYNRAKKKTKANFFISFMCINLFFILAVVSLLFFKYYNVTAIIISIAYMIMLIIVIIIFIKNNNRIDKMYADDITLFTDDDEYWIGGIIYYNPNDKRILVETRMTSGSTVNFAGTFGKVTAAILALSIIASIAVIVWSGMLEGTPIDLRLDGDDIICHQLRDEYVIPASEIESVEYGSDINKKTMIRTNGVGMDSLLKGNFIVDDEKGCKMFLNPNIKAYIHIKTNDGTSYYISSATKDKTKEIYETIK